MTVNREMPRYICHKQVWALKIESVQEGVKDKNSVLLTFADEGYAPIHVDFDWYYRHKPEAGGYYVVYKDGYKSFSPAAAFEDGYTLQGAAQAPQNDDETEGLRAHIALLKASLAQCERELDELRVATQAPQEPEEPLPPPGIHAAVHYAGWLRREAHRHQEPKAGVLRQAARMLDVLKAECGRLHQELIDAQAPAVPEGHILTEREALADLVVREACETEPADPDDPETIMIRRSDLRWATLAAMLAAAPTPPASAPINRDAVLEEAAQMLDTAFAASATHSMFAGIHAAYQGAAKSIRALKDKPPASAAPAPADLDAAFEAVRKRLCKLPKYSFLLDGNGGVRRVTDTCGNWIEFDAAHALFDPVAVDAAIQAGGSHD